MYFAATGAKTVRIQTREDGVAIDQIVLSPSRFIDLPPGRALNDATRVNLDGTTTVISGTVTPPPTTPRTLAFTASADHALVVVSYKLEIFKQGVNPSTGLPSGTLSLGKPAVTNGQIGVDITATVQALSAGTYVATVSAAGTAGFSRSAASAPFTR